MSPTLAQALDEGRELTADEARQYVAEQVQEHFGLTVEEFNRRAEAGELSPDDDPMVIHLALLTGVRLPSC